MFIRTSSKVASLMGQNGLKNYLSITGGTQYTILLKFLCLEQACSTGYPTQH